MLLYLEIELFHQLLPISVCKYPILYQVCTTYEILPVMELNNPRQPLIHQQYTPIFFTYSSYSYLYLLISDNAFRGIKTCSSPKMSTTVSN